MGAINTDETYGMRAVRIGFNPSGNAQVNEIKQRAADLIDLVRSLPTTDDNGRLKSLACTEFELGAMWAVKAAT
jgi:hypothetical protein